MNVDKIKSVKVGLFWEENIPRKALEKLFVFAWMSC